MSTFLPYVAVFVLGLAGGWFGHMRWGKKAQAVVDAAKAP